MEFHERRLEDIAAHLNRFDRADEKPFEAVAEVSEFNQRAYELLARPFVQAVANEPAAAMLRALHPLRVQNWALSQFNPWMAWLEPAASTVKAHRQAVAPEQPLRQAETRNASLFSAVLDHYRAVRDAMTEAGFFSAYAPLVGPAQAGGPEQSTPADVRETPVVRVALLLKRKGEPLPLSRLELQKELLPDYAADLPPVAPHDWRRIRGEQEILVRDAPDRALDTLATLLPEPAERKRLLALLAALMADKRVQARAPTPTQKAMLERIRKTLAARRRPVSGRKPAASRA